MDEKSCITVVVFLTLCVMRCICSETDRDIEELKKTVYCTNGTNRNAVYKNPTWNKCLLDDGTSKCGVAPEMCNENRTKSLNGSDICESNMSSKCFGPNYPGFQQVCFCDQNCAEFGDCCPDIQNRQDSSWMCRSLKYIPNIYIYMNQQCPVSWMDEQVKQLCEYEPDHLWRQGKYYHHLQDIPVYSIDRSIMHRNVFCAMCNNDTNLYRWNTYFDCGDARENVTIRDAVFQPDKKTWTIPDKNITCNVMVSELKSWNDVSKVYNARRCRGISKCSPTWDGADEKLKCDSVTKDQYMYYSIIDGTLFKNPHCALCNYLNITSLTCKSVAQTEHDGIGSFFESKVWYPVILDFNFHGDSEQLCYTDELYDPILKTCLQLPCGQSYVRIGDKCVPTDKNNSGLPDCFKVTLDRKYFVNLPNDTVYVNHSGKYYTKNEYEAVLSDGEIIKILICTGEVINFNFSPVQYWLSEIGIILSITCLLIHLTVYLLLPKLHNLPGKILISLSASLLMAQFSFLLGSYTHDGGINTWYCISFGVITHFSHLSAFFWMNIMAFDVCRTFCISTPRSEHSKTFLKYSLYGWLSPTLIVLVSLVLNFVSDPTNLYSPQYGKNACWISQKRALLIFFALPVFIVLLSNFILFFITARSLSKTAQETKIANKFSDRVRFFLYVKLALILGLTWIFGFIATLTKLNYLWYPFIVFNTLQGVFILLSFTVKKKTWKYLKERLHIKEGKIKNIGYMKQCTSTSNLSTIQTSLSSSLSASVPVLCHQKDIIVHAMVNGNLKPMSKKSVGNLKY